MTLFVEFLGPLAVSVDGRAVVSWRPKHRQLITLLGTRPDRSVSVDTLVDQIWPDRPPEAAVANIRTYVAAIRSSLGARHQIVTTSNGYRWSLGPGDTDIGRALTLADQARRLHGRNIAAACHVWDSAVMLIDRGSPFEDIPESPHAEAMRAALVSQFAAIREERFATYLAARRAQSILAEIITHVRNQPLREEASSQLIYAFQAVGDTNAAINAYHTARANLTCELGVEPGASLQTALTAILRGSAHDVAITASASPLVSDAAVMALSITAGSGPDRGVPASDAPRR